ncbi:hypothetical protein Tco_1050286 [Tanacetum coccineum]
MKAITTQSSLVLDEPSVLMPPPFINPVEDERAEETLTDPELAEYTIKVPPPLVQKAKPPSLRNYVVHKRDPLHPNIPYPSRMHQEKQQEKDEMLKALLSDKEKLLELANTPLNENCSTVILKKLPKKLGVPGKFLIPCGFSELKCKALADLGESSTAPFLREDIDGLFHGLMRRDINSLFGQMASLSRRLCGRETAHALVKKKGKAKDEYYGKLILDLVKKLKKELEEARLSNTFLRMQNERVERDLYWTRVRAHEFYQEMIRRGFVFEERPNEAIDVPIEDEKSPLSEPRGSPPDV